MSQSTLNNAVVQKKTADPNNSSTTNLSVSNSYTFTGTISSSSTVSGIQVALFSDQNCTVTIQQSQDQTPNWDISDSFQYYAGKSFGVTVHAISSFFRVIVTSDGNATTTVFRLQTNLCPIVEPMPRTLDNDGNLKVAVQSSRDEYGFASEFTPNGEMRVSEVCRLTGPAFDLSGNSGAVDPNYWTTTVANNGTVVQANGQVTLDTATTSANGSAVMSSVRRARFVAGSANRYRSVLLLNNNGATNNIRKWGIAYGSGFPATPTVTDGAWFQLNGTQFSVNTQLANGAVATVTSFNGNLGTAYKPDFTISHEYEIYFDNTGCWFTVDGELLHNVVSGTSPFSATASMYIYHATINSSSLQTSNTIVLRSAAIHRLGKEYTSPQRGLVTTAGTYNFKYGPGVLQSIVIATAGGTLMTIYDDTTGTANTIMAIGAFNNNSVMPVSLQCNIPFSNGLKVVSTGTWSAAFVYE